MILAQTTKSLQYIICPDSSVGISREPKQWISVLSESLKPMKSPLVSKEVIVRYTVS